MQPPALGEVAHSDQGLHRLAQVEFLRRPATVVADGLGAVGAGPADGAVGQRDRHPVVQPGAVDRFEVGEQQVPHQPLREPEAVRVDRIGAQQPAVQRVVDQARWLAQSGEDVGEQPAVHGRADHRAGLQHPDDALRALGQAGAQHQPQVEGERGGRFGGSGHGGGGRPQLGEQVGVAAGGAVGGRHQVPGGRLASGAVDQGPGLGEREHVEVQVLGGDLLEQVGDRSAEFGALGEPVLPDGRDHQQVAVAELLGEQLEEGQGAGVGEVQVLQEEHQRAAGGGQQGLADGVLEGQVPGGGERRLGARGARRAVRAQHAEGVQDGLGQGGQFGGPGAAELADDPGPQPVLGEFGAGGAVRPDGVQSGGRQSAGQFLEQPGLADALFADHQDGAAAAAGCGECPQGGQFPGAADQPSGWCDGRGDGRRGGGGGRRRCGARRFGHGGGGGGERRGGARDRRARGGRPQRVDVGDQGEAGAQGGRGGGPPARVHEVLTQDRAVQLLEFLAGVGAQFLGEVGPDPFEGQQCLGGLAAVVLRQHELAAQPFQHRVAPDLVVEFAHHLVVPGQAEAGVGPGLQAHQAQLFEPGGLQLGEVVGGQFPVRGAVPEAERLVDGAAGRGQVPAGELLAPGLDGGLEPAGVYAVPVDLQDVAGGLVPQGQQPVLGVDGRVAVDRLAQPGDVRLEGADDGLRR